MRFRLRRKSPYVSDYQRQQQQPFPKKGGYSGGRPASEMGPPKQVPSATIRPRPSFRLEAAAIEREVSLDRALVEAWHDVTCPEGPDCRDRSIHMLSATNAMVALGPRIAQHPAVVRAIGAAPPNGSFSD